MGVITIARQYGAGGEAVGRLVAERLGWNLLDHAIIDEVAARLRLSDEEVAARDERPNSFLDQLLVALGASSMEFAAAGDVPAWTPPFASAAEDTRQAVMKITQEVIREAARGNAVVVGRGGAYILRDHPAALHVYLRAGEAFRLQVVRERLGVDEQEARKRLKETDANRTAAIRQLYGHDWSHASHYDLVVDTGRLGFDLAAEVILTAARARLS